MNATGVTAIDAFFKQYEDNFNESLTGGKPNIDAVVNSFANCFIEAGPGAINCGQNGDTFREKIPQGYEFYKKIGITGMRILSKQVTPLDDLHHMVRVKWQSAYTDKKANKGTIDFDVIYFLQVNNNDCKIFCYITGDEQKALKERGLV